MQISNQLAGAQVTIEPRVMVGDTVGRETPGLNQEIELPSDRKRMSQLREIIGSKGLPMLDTVPPAIDMWLERNGFNQYGDPADVAYTGGSPLYDEASGKTMTRLACILRKHPYLESLLPGHGGSLQPFLPLPPQLYPQLPTPTLPGYQQLQQILQQMMNMLSSLLGALFNKPPQYGMPQPLPGLQPIGGNYPISPITMMERKIGKVKNDLEKLEARIRRYESSGRPAPRAWKQRQIILKNQLAQLQYQLYQMSQPHAQPYPLGYKQKDVVDLFLTSEKSQAKPDSTKASLIDEKQASAIPEAR